MADGSNFPAFSPQQPGWVRVQPDPKVPGQAKANPFWVYTVGGVNITNRGNAPIPVAVQKALPYLAAKNYVVQDLSKYLMQPGRLYDIQDWSAASGIGAASYTFFQRAFGSVAGQRERTNMPQPGNIGQNNAFVITRIGISFISGITPVQTGTDAQIAGAQSGVNDAYTVLNRGVFQLNVNGVGQFFQGVAPLTALPAPNYFNVTGGIATGNAVADSALSYQIEGDTYSFLETPITLIGGANFDASIAFPQGAITLPSANNTSKIAVYLDGYSMRPAG